MTPSSGCPGVAAGIVAAGHAVTADAAAEILADGGNAVDAVIAAMAAACIAEPVMASLGGGGYMLLRPAGKNSPVRVVDFFPDTPRHRHPDARAFPVEADFGPATQPFLIGPGCAACPGFLSGMAHIQQSFASLPLERLLAPAIATARTGVTVCDEQAVLFQIVAPIYQADEAVRGCFMRDGDMLKSGDLFINPDLAHSLEELARVGADAFLAAMASQVQRFCADNGGHLQADDLTRYSPRTHPALLTTPGGHQLFTTPPPAAGGVLAARIMARLASPDSAKSDPCDMARAIAAAGLERAGLIERGVTSGDSPPLAPGGTTHISVIDRRGNAAAATVSNGEGCGYFLPGTGIILNNMLGEVDIIPGGREDGGPGGREDGGWPLHTRMASMMTPSALHAPDGSLSVIGSGGSLRIPGVIAQVVSRLIGGDSLTDAINAPRLHVEDGVLNFEDFLPSDTRRRLLQEFPDVLAWPERSMYFGGANGACRHADGSVDGASDPRRGGAVRIV